MTPARLAFTALLAVIALGPVLLPESLVTMLNYTGLYSLVAIGLALLTIGGMTSWAGCLCRCRCLHRVCFTATVGLSPWIALIGLAFTAVTALMLER
jgi:branched-chain amino acid transport system permease protein